MPDENINIENEASNQDEDLTNTIDLVKEQDINRDEIILRAAANRARDLEEFERERLKKEIKIKGMDIENQYEKLQEKHSKDKYLLDTKKLDNAENKKKIHDENNRRDELLDQIHRNYIVTKNNFYFKDRLTQLAFNDKGNKLVSNLNDERVGYAMAMMAEARGWKTIKIKGHPTFCREVWMEASLRGINVRGFEPHERDVRELENRREQSMRNTLEKSETGEYQKIMRNKQESIQKPSQSYGNPLAERQTKAKPETVRTYQGRLIEQGAAPYEHNPENNKNYFVRLETTSGEKTIWGVDLKRALEDSKAKQGDVIKLEYLGSQPVTVKTLERDSTGKVIGEKEIETQRNTWNVEKTEKHKVAEAVAMAVVSDKIKNPEIAQAAIAKIRQMLEQRAKEGKMPTVSIYDKNAQSKIPTHENSAPIIEQNAERTR